MYDIIGDTHGHAKKLDRLLLHMEYPFIDGEFAPHPEGRKVWLAGDYINRGQDSEKVVARVQGLMNRGIAEGILGNHDYDTVLWATPDPRRPGQFLRPHIEEEYGERHGFLKKLSADADFCKSTIEWFKTLPLYLKRDNYRLVHACWHQQSIDLLQRHDCMTKDGRLTEKGWLAGGDVGSPLQKAISILLKGPEEKLGEGLSYPDWDGNRRDSARIAWWKDDATTIGEAFASNCIPDMRPFAALPYKKDMEQPVIQEIRKGLRELPPDVRIFIGHIWETGEPKPLSDRVACVDYGSSDNAKLVAYRTVRGEAELKAQNFCWAPNL